MRMAARDKRTNRESIAMHVNLDDSWPLDKSLIRLNKQHRACQKSFTYGQHVHQDPIHLRQNPGYKNREEPANDLFMTPPE